MNEKEFIYLAQLEQAFHQIWISGYKHNHGTINFRLIRLTSLFQKIVQTKYKKEAYNRDMENKILFG